MSLTFTAPLRANKPRRNVNFIGAGGSSSFAIDKKGRAWLWGNNSNGKLGNGTITERFTPISIGGSVKTFCQIAKGITFCSSIDKNGLVWGWGYGTYGQLGNGTAVASQLTPVSVTGVRKTFCKVAVGQNDVRAIDQYGRLWAWGINSAGQLGDNTTVSKRTPVSVLGAVKTFCKIAATALGSAGNGSSYAIDKNGVLWTWGFGGAGRLGSNATTNRSTPAAIYGSKTFCEISAGWEHAAAIDKNGRAWSWGRNQVGGSLGDGTAVFSRITPVSVVGAVKTFCKISSGGYSSLALDKNGRLWAWGDNSSGQLGDGTITNRNTPVSVLGVVKTFCEISAGTNHGTAVDKNGRAWAWGLNSSGALGINVDANKCTPVSIVGAVKTFCEIFSDSNVAAIDKNGRAWGWGLNSLGQVGDGTAIPMKRTPVSVIGAVKTFCKITTGIGSAHALAIDKNGRAWGWGWNGYRQLGDNTGTNRCTPVSVAGTVKTFCEISSGWGHGLAIDKNGRVWAWGLNNTYQAGDGTPNTVVTPKSIVGAVKTFCRISAGYQYSLAIEKNGQVWAWGRNANAQTGVPGAGVNVTTPTAIGGLLKTFCKIDAGQVHSMAIDKNGRAWGWGDNGSGRIGNGTAGGGIGTPVSVAGAIKTFCHISAGNAHTVAIDKNGRAWGWGYNAQGQIGDNSKTSRLTPVSVAGAIKTFCKINAGASSTIALDKNGRVWAWGNNPYGQTGNGVSLIVETPVQICNI